MLANRWKNLTSLRLLRATVRRYLTRSLRVPEMGCALEHLARRGFEPKLIFDVGAYQGEFAELCLQSWPHAQIACFEPLKHKLEQLDVLAKQRPGIRVFAGLLGAKCQQSVAFHEMETASSVLTEWAQPEYPAAQHPMSTIDRAVKEAYGGTSPDLLKLDVQGYELEVLKGAESSLERMQAIIAEINLMDIHMGVPLLAEVVGWLNDRDWVAYDICGLHWRPLDKALWSADFVFVPTNSPLRTNKSWA